MTNFRLLGAAAILCSVLAGPAMAQQVISNPGKCQAQYPNANCLNEGPGNPYTAAPGRTDTTRPTAATSAHRTIRRTGTMAGTTAGMTTAGIATDSGFWPGDVAADVVGGAVGTAGAIATAPFRGDSYAYDYDGYRGGYNQSWAARNGFVCQPGTWFKGDDGRRHICQ